MSSLEDFPAGRPPPGVKSNFVDPENRTTAAITVTTIATTFVLLFVVPRIYIRSIKREFWWDEGSIVWGAVTIDGCLKAVGRHQWDIRASTFIKGDGILQEILIYQTAYSATIFMAKLSLFLLYRRLFSPSRLMRRYINFGILATGIFYTFSTIFPIIMCSPRKGETRLMSQSSARCGKDRILGYIMTIFNVVSDHYLLIIPMPIIWKLQMPTRKKVEISAIFSMGFLGCICGIVNSYYRVVLYKTSDAMWHTVPVLLTSLVEINVGIIVGCMPALKPFIQTNLVKSLQLLSFSHIRSRLHMFRSQSYIQPQSPISTTDLQRFDSNPDENRDNDRRCQTEDTIV